MTKAQIMGTVVLAGLGTVLVLNYQFGAKLRAENGALQRRLAELRSPDRMALADSGASPAGDPAIPDPLREMERLHADLAALQKETGALENLQAENRQLRALAMAGGPQDDAEAEFKEQTERRVHDLKRWALVFILHAVDAKANGQFPQDWREIANRVPPAEAETFRFATNNFEILYHGTRNSMTNAGHTILLREKQPRQSPSGQWIRVYALGDGSAHTLGSVDGSFDGVERRLTGRP